MAHSAEHRLHDLLEGFDTAMVVTKIGKGSLHARPMGVAEITELGEIYFVTAAQSKKAHPSPAPCAADPPKTSRKGAKAQRRQEEF